MFPGFNIVFIVETFLAFIIAQVLHDVTHASVAAALGDNTLASRGRLSLSPRRQLASIGTIVGIVVSFSTFGFGWGKPLDLDARRMRVGPNLGTILVAVSGPLLNMLLGVGIAFGLRALPGYVALSRTAPFCGSGGLALQDCLSHVSGVPGYALRLEQFAFIFAVTNIVIALLNIIPLHPLDGYHVLFALLPSRQAITYRTWQPYMELILLVIFFVVPVLFQFIGLGGFNPAAMLGGGAQTIANAIMHGTYDFARFI